MKKSDQFNMRCNDDFTKKLELICATRAGIRTKAQAIEYCVDMIVMEIEKEKKSKGK